MRTNFLVVAMVVGMTASPAPAQPGNHAKDTPEEVKKALKDGKAVLLDVREKNEWDAGHLKDAQFLPLSTLKGGAKAEDVAKIAPKDKIVYCHCGSGVRSLKAADELKKLGYDVRPLKPGFKELLEAGFEPAEKK